MNFVNNFSAIIFPHTSDSNPWVPVGVALAPCIYFLSGSVYSDLRLSHLHLADYMIK